jgi:hypothetical protein
MAGLARLDAVEKRQIFDPRPIQGRDVTIIGSCEKAVVL